jgi:hypothetical protein
MVKPTFRRCAVLAVATLVAATTTFVTADAATPPPRITLIPPPDTPAGVAAMKDRSWRRTYAAELSALDRFLAAHPALKPYRDRLWYVGWHNHSQASPHQLAGLVWCVTQQPTACG